MVSRVDTATRHKREQHCYSFMHIYIHLLLLLSGQGERLFDRWPSTSHPSPETAWRSSRKSYKGPDHRFLGLFASRVALRWAITADKMSASRTGRHNGRIRPTAWQAGTVATAPAEGNRNRRYAADRRSTRSASSRQAMMPENRRSFAAGLD